MPPPKHPAPTTSARIGRVSAWDQDGYGVRVEWGPTGAARLAPHVACLVVVDVLSFTTAVSVASDAGTTVYPYAWRDETAAAYADASARDWRWVAGPPTGARRGRSRRRRCGRPR